MKTCIVATLAVLGMTCCHIAGASSRTSPATAGVHQAPPEIVESDTFRNGHPDMRWRQDGLRALERGDERRAFGLFQRAARYADKPSQAMVAEMLWNGRGTLRDRPLAYAWMDLAAERMQPDLLARRELYWSRLGADERAKALELGRAVYADYADDVAKPRQAREMARVLNEMTGSRVGWSGFMKSTPYRDHKGFEQIDSTVFFADRYWDQAEYWQWQDDVLRAVDDGPGHASR